MKLFQIFKLTITMTPQYIKNYAFTIISIFLPLNLIALHRLSHDRELQTQVFQNTSILFVIAHPDDETMFFGPSIINLLDLNTNLTFLCLSTGNADNLGSVRTNELEAVINKLGPKARLEIHDDSTNLNDNMPWKAASIKKVVANTLKLGSFDSIITFDSYGVSGHTNHVSIYNAIREIAEEDKSLRIYNLKSVNMLRKYSSFFDSFVTYMGSQITLSNKEQSETHIVMAINLSSYSKSVGLLKLHTSQMVWFRQLYMIFSRYMLLNDLESLHV